VFTVQSAFTGGGNASLQQMYLQQKISGEAFTIALGRLAPADTFAPLPVLANYVNGALTVPGSININDSSFAAGPPGVEWGAQALYNVTPTVQVATGVFDTNPTAAAGGENGVNFAFQQGNTGELTIAQVSYFHNQATETPGCRGSIQWAVPTTAMRLAV